MIGSGGSVGFPMPRSITSTPATRFSYFTLLILAKRYGGSRWSRSATGIEKGLSDCGVSDSLRMKVIVRGSRRFAKRNRDVAGSLRDQAVSTHTFRSAHAPCFLSAHAYV